MQAWLGWAGCFTRLSADNAVMGKNVPHPTDVVLMEIHQTELVDCILTNSSLRRQI